MTTIGSAEVIDRMVRMAGQPNEVVADVNELGLDPAVALERRTAMVAGTLRALRHPLPTSDGSVWTPG